MEIPLLHFGLSQFTMQAFLATMPQRGLLVFKQMSLAMAAPALLFSQVQTTSSYR